jgi:hypothetical protein
MWWKAGLLHPFPHCSCRPTQAPRPAPPGSPLVKGFARQRLGRWRDGPCGAHRASAEVLPLDWRVAPCGVPSLRRLAAALMVCVAPVRVQEDLFAVMESCQKAIECMLKRSAAEGRLITRG